MKPAILNKFMDVMGFGGEEEYDEVEEYVDDEVEEQDHEDSLYTRPKTRTRRSFSEIEKDSPYGAKNVQAKVIPMNTAVSSSKMVITQPTSFEDVEEIGAYLKNKKSVIINLENVSKEDARRVLDFLGGAAFMIEGTIQQVSNLIYLMAPRDIEIQNDIERSQYKQQKASFSWLK